MKDFVPKQQSVELKELGFDEPCFSYYSYPENKVSFVLDGHGEVSERRNSQFGYAVSRPLLSQAFRWFWEKHGINSTVDWVYNDGFHYFFKWTEPNGNFGDSDRYFYAPEEAELECLRKLIKIVKDKNKSK